jgi:ATP/maltotriose-dependent transcriptional regulator MalT
VHVFSCRWGEAGRAFEQAFRHAHRAGHQQVAAQTLVGLATAFCLGPTPVQEAIRRVEEAIAELAGSPDAKPPRLVDRAILEAWGLARLEAMQGRFDRARQLCEQARSVFEEFGQSRRLADLSEVLGEIDMLARDLEAAEKELRSGYEALESMGDKAVLSTVAAELAETVYAQGRDEEAERLTEESERLAGSDDVESQIRWRTMKAKLETQKGDLAGAEALAREAVKRASEIEYPNLQAGTLIVFAEVLGLRGRTSEAVAVASQALEHYEAKGNVVSTAHLRELLARLG